MYDRLKVMSRRASNINIFIHLKCKTHKLLLSNLNFYTDHAYYDTLYETLKRYRSKHGLCNHIYLLSQAINLIQLSKYATEYLLNIYLVTGFESHLYTKVFDTQSNIRSTSYFTFGKVVNYHFNKRKVHQAIKMPYHEKNHKSHFQSQVTFINV